MRIVDIQDEAVIDAYRSHGTLCKAAGALGCSKSYVWRVLKRHGVRLKKKGKKARTRKPWPSHCKSRYCHAIVCILVEHGYSQTQIANITRIPPSTVCDIVRRKRPALYRTRFGAKQVDMDAIESEYLSGASTYDLARKYGVRHETISRWMRQRGHTRGKGNRINNHEAVRRFLADFPDLIDEAKSANARYAVRRKYRIVSRRHDGPPSGLTWRDVAAHNGGDIRCWICGKSCDPGDNGGMHPSIDHVVPLSNGGTDTYDNVRIAHVECNCKRNNRTQLTLDYLMYEVG